MSSVAIADEQPLTREIILSLPAGHEIDRLVNVRVHGANRSLVACDWAPCLSTSLDLAMYTVEVLSWNHWRLRLEDYRWTNPPCWSAIFYDDGQELAVPYRGDTGEARAPTAALAVCRAALLVTLYETWRIE